MLYATSSEGVGVIQKASVQNVKGNSAKNRENKISSAKEHNPFAIKVVEIEDVDEATYYISLIDKALANGSILKLDSKTITREEALEAIKYPYIGLQEDFLTVPKELIISKNPMTSANDYYYEGTLLSEKEYLDLLMDKTLTTRKIRGRKNGKKGEYWFEKK